MFTQASRGGSRPKRQEAESKEIDWDEVEQSAAFYGLKPGEVYDLTPREWANHIKGVDTKRHQRLEYDRVFFAALVNMQAKDPMDADRMFPFHWDNNGKPRTSYFTQEEKEAILKATAHW